MNHLNDHMLFLSRGKNKGLQSNSPALYCLGFATILLWSSESLPLKKEKLFKKEIEDRLKIKIQPYC